MKIITCSLDNLNDVYSLDKDIYGDGCYPLFVIRQFYDCFGDMIKVAIHNNKTIGFSINGTESNSKTGWILSLAVDVNYRNRGVGWKLLAESTKDFKLKGVEIVKLTVHPENDAIKLYERFGFKKHKLINDYYGDDQERVLMILTI